MKSKKKLLCSLSLFILLACNNEGKDSVEKADSANEARKDNADSLGTYQVDAESADFLVKAANAEMTVIKLGEVAAQKAMHTKVKEMGEMMIKDHTAGNDELKKLAAGRNVSLPETIGGDMQKQVEELGGKKGKDFDRAYISQMIKDHEETISLFKRATEKVNDQDVRTFANNTLPKLQEHLDSFKVVQKIIN
jgi:putative membrane protein